MAQRRIVVPALGQRASVELLCVDLHNGDIPMRTEYDHEPDSRTPHYPGTEQL
ncbi:hypothetical protein [Yersinia kristensenii]|uniref:hypothetical protein n=1 Tax=Yersinia kristensenii TaxID=28152 RepID=UPI0029D41343|nr:hypothetical protein [Yersinia kristensenii]